MSDLHFLQRLGAEFTQLEHARADGQPGRLRLGRGRAPRGMMAALGLGFSVLVVIAVFVISVGVHSPERSGSPAPAQSRVMVTFSATAIDPTAGLGSAITRAIPILRRQLAAVPGVRITRTAGGVAVTATGGQPARAEIAALALDAPQQLSFYDWEADVLTPQARTVASLPFQDPVALTISQGSASAATGEPGAGGLPLYSAVRLAARQPPVDTTSGRARPGRQYYLFGAPGSAACATAARDQHITPAANEHCMLLSGPVTETSTNRDQIDRDLSAALLPGVSAAHARLLAVPQGIVVLLARSRDGGGQPSATVSSRYFVLRDRVALAGRNVTDPQQSTDQSGQPDVHFRFTPTGSNAFQRVTARIAHRGTLISPFRQSLNQHFAVAFGGRLITVPQIDFKIYPDGVQGNMGADITGGFSVRSAQALAAALALGPLPVRLAVR